MSSRLGLDAVLYRNTGNYASPVWNEIPNVKDVNLALEKGEAEVSRRGSGGWKATVGTLKDASIEFDMIFRDDDADFESLRDSFLNNTTVEMAVMDGDIVTTGSQGLRATMQVMKFARNEPLDQSITYSVTMKPTDSDNPPEWLEI